MAQPVISPHEGLWDQGTYSNLKLKGVISPHEGLWDGNRDWQINKVYKLFLPMRGYEIIIIVMPRPHNRLFLPMRGYEKVLHPPDADRQ